MKRSVRTILLVVALLMAAALSYAVVKVQKQADAEVIPEAGTAANSGAPAKYLSIGGKDVPLRRRMKTVLVIGTDKSRENQKQKDFVSFYNYEQCDFVTVLAFDEDNGTVTPLQLNRDTMCSVPWLSVNGLVGGHTIEQLALAHTYGSGNEDSCENTVRTVSDLLCGLPIDYYISFTLDAVPIMNDLVGGVTVTLEEDIPALGEEYVRGATITLRGKEALSFVRWRDLYIVGSNAIRMMTQRLYLAGFTEAAKAAVEKNPDLAVDAFKAVDGFICTNMTANNISELVDKLVSYEIAPVISPEGEIKLGEEFAEFYVDEADLQRCVREAFCS